MDQQEPLVIPGEPRLSQRIREAANRDALGRAAVLSGQGDLAAAARFTAAALLCRGGDKPCGVCPDCRKVLRDVHPDVLTVTDPEHKNVSVEILRNVTADASVLPNEGRRKVYIFPDCSLLDGKAQNVLLKVVEDGPVHAAFLFCAANSAVLLPTIRSRTAEWKLSPPPETAADPGPAAPPLPDPAPEHVPPASRTGADPADSSLWNRLIDSYKSRLPAMYRAFLDGAAGLLAGDVLTVVCNSDFTKTQLHNVKVQSVLQEVTSEDQGRPIAVTFTVGVPPKAAETAGSGDKIDDLIRFGSQFDNFKIT